MKKQIKSFSPHQTAKVFAILVTVIALPYTIYFLILINSSPPRAPLGFSLMALFLYPVSSYVLVTIVCWFYNVMFKYIGGIEIEFDDE